MLTSTVGLGAICGARLDAAAAGDRRADRARARQHPGDLAGDPRLHRDRPVLSSRCLASFSPAAAMTITGIGAQTLIQAAVDVQHARPHHGALRHDLPRRPGGRRGADGLAQRALRAAPAARGRRRRLLRLLGASPGSSRSASPRPSRPTRQRRPDTVMSGPHLFCFGLGYSALALARRLAGEGWTVSGTCRDARDGRRRCARPGSRSSCSTATVRSPRRRSTGSTHLLVSVPPDAAGDPVLDRHGADIAALTGALPGSAICRPPASTATAAAAGSTRRSELRPTGERGRRRVAAEQGWLDLWRDRGVPVHIFRLAAIYGPGRSAVRGAARRHRQADRQAGPGVLAHPCRRSGECADRLDGAAAAGCRLQCLRRRASSARRRSSAHAAGTARPAGAAAGADRRGRAVADGAELLRRQQAGREPR